MSNKTKLGLVLLVVGLFVATMYVGLNRPSENVSVEKNYAGLYALHLIPNSYELPATKADKILATSTTGDSELVESPFGWTYVRATR
jgi:hypothetical protein